MYDLIVIGGGPAGISAGTLAINRRLEVLVVAECWGGQTAYSMQLEDTEGREIITGEALLDAFRRQLDYLDFVRHFGRVSRIVPREQHFSVSVEGGKDFDARTLVIASGAKPQRLNVPGEVRLAGYGVSYSVATHAALFLGKDVLLVGIGRHSHLAALDLARKAHQVYFVSPEPLPDTPLAGRVRQFRNVEIMENATVKEIYGERFVELVAVQLDDGEREIPVSGVFNELPRTPNSELVRDWVDCDKQGRILVDVQCATSYPGAFAAGDVTNITEQALVHIGEGAKAAISAYNYLLAH